MAITIRPDGSIVASTPQEAVEVQRLIMARQSMRTTSSQVKLNPADSVPQRLIKSLRQYDGQEINAEQLSKVIGLKTAQGVGTKMRHLDRAFRAEGMDLNAVLPSHSGAKGLKRWTVRIPKANGSA